MHVLKIAAQAIGFAALANAARLVVVVPPSQLLPEPSSLPSSTHAVLLGSPGGARYDSLLRRDNTFVFPELALDSYLFTIYARDYNFAPLRVDVATNASSTALSSEKYESSTVITAWQTFRGNEWSNKGPELDSARDTLIIRVQPLSGKDYYQQRAGFSILSFLKNPMILMGLFSVVMIVGIPYVMDNCEYHLGWPIWGTPFPRHVVYPSFSLSNFNLSQWTPK
jgi:hypothetical protein